MFSPSFTLKTGTNPISPSVLLVNSDTLVPDLELYPRQLISGLTGMTVLSHRQTELGWFLTGLVTRVRTQLQVVAT